MTRVVLRRRLTPLARDPIPHGLYQIRIGPINAVVLVMAGEPFVAFASKRTVPHARSRPDLEEES